MSSRAVVLPEKLSGTLVKNGLEAKVSFRLACGTYSVGGSYNRMFAGRQITEYEGTFREFKEGKAVGDYSLNSGTINPSSLGPSNHIIFVMVDVAKSKTWWEGLMRFVDKLGDGENFVVAAWMPDGAHGKVIVDRESANYGRWISASGAGLRYWAAILGVAFVAMLLSCVVPCLVMIFPFVAGYFWKRHIDKKRSEGMLTNQDLENLLNYWCLQMMENGVFESAYLEAFGVQGEQSDRL